MRSGTQPVRLPTVQAPVTVERSEGTEKGSHMKTKLRNAMVGLAAVGMVAGGATSASAHEGRLVGVNNVSYQSCTWEVAAQVGALRATGHLPPDPETILPQFLSGDPADLMSDGLILARKLHR